MRVNQDGYTRWSGEMLLYLGGMDFCKELYILMSSTYNTDANGNTAVHRVKIEGVKAGTPVLGAATAVGDVESDTAHRPHLARLHTNVPSSCITALILGNGKTIIVLEKRKK